MCITGVVRDVVLDVVREVRRALLTLINLTILTILTIHTVYISLKKISNRERKYKHLDA